MENAVGERLFVRATSRNTVAAQVHQHLRHEIISGALLPRQSISEPELAARFKLSRTPVREALKKLEEEGLIVAYPQYGTFVAPIRVSDIRDNHFIRESIECAAMVKAAARATDEDKERLFTLLELQKKNVDAGETIFFQADESMHAAILQIAGHENAWRIVESAKSQLDRIRHLSMARPLKRQLIVEEHAEIIELFARGDTAGAAASLRRHIRGIFRSTLLMIDTRPDFFESEVGLEAEMEDLRRSAAD